MDDPAAEGNIVVSVQLTLPVEEEAVLEEEAGARGEVEWEWARCLSIPRVDALKLSPNKPYKWIRYITGAGLGAEGVLCDSDDANTPEIDYNRPLLPGNSSLYFHVTPAERARIFPLDPRLADPYSATGTAASTRCVRHREVIVRRDGRCVATDEREVDCDAAHLIGHTKGDMYIKALTQARSRDPNGSDCIDDIDDIRNGFLVNKYLHGALARRDAAVLLTPNFAMSSSDVDPNLQADEQRWTLHNIEGVLDPETQTTSRRTLIPHNQPLRVPADQSDWPPRILFDTVYASAIWKLYHHEDYDTVVNVRWQDRFYPGGVRNTRADGGMAEISRQRAEESAQKAQNDQKRNERIAKRQNRDGGTEEMDPLDAVFMASLLVRRPPTRKQRERWVAEQRELEAAKRRELEQKVTSWWRATRV